MTTKTPQKEFSTPAVITTPYERSDRIGDIQWLLSGNNKLNVKTYTGRIDKEYGPVTAGSSKEAKYQIGYLPKDIDTVFGQQLYEFLTGQRELPAAYKARAKKRAALTKDSPKLKALKLAATQIGTKESPFGSNKQKYGAWYGYNGVAWCGIFISWCISNATGVTWKQASVPVISSLAEQGKYYMTVTHSPEPGDIVTFDFSVVNAHVEFFEKPIDSISFGTIGGNTGPSNVSNGGEVLRNVRYYSNVHHFCKLTLPSPKEAI